MSTLNEPMQTSSSEDKESEGEETFSLTSMSISGRSLLGLESSLFTQRNRKVYHPSLPDDCATSVDESFSFVIGADTQLGMLNCCKDWDAELETSRKAVAAINALEERPAFVSMCGDIADMEPNAYMGQKRGEQYCVEIQKRQFDDFKDCWKDLHPDIALVCLCGNHDVGNAPTVQSVDRFKSSFGDDYYAFWCKGCYCICLNTNLYNDYSNAPELYKTQHAWLEQQLQFASTAGARRIFMFGHHPWFLFDEEEDEKEMTGYSPLWPGAEHPEAHVPDAYFIIKREERRKVLALCKRYKVDAAFAGHFHQNHISETSFGMAMIVTGPLTPVVLHSTAIDEAVKKNATAGPGFRVVKVDNSLDCGFSHHYEVI